MTDKVGTSPCTMADQHGIGHRRMASARMHPLLGKIELARRP